MGMVRSMRPRLSPVSDDAAISVSIHPGATQFTVISRGASSVDSDLVNEMIAPFEAGLPFFFSFPETSHYTTQVIVGPDRATSNVNVRLYTLVGGQTTQGRRCDDADGGRLRPERGDVRAPSRLHGGAASNA